MQQRKLKISEESWRGMSKDEIHAYFALCILMSQVKKLNFQSYW